MNSRKGEKSSSLFDPLVSENSMFSRMPSIELDEDELRLLWALEKDGPTSIYGLSSLKFGVPHLKSPRELMDRSIHIIGTRDEPERGISYRYEDAFYTIKGLEQKGLVEKPEKSAKRDEQKVRLTFQGLMLCLTNFEEKKKFEKAILHYGKLLPFSENWKMLTKSLDWEKILKALDQAAKDCVNFRKATFRISHLNLEFTGFLEGKFITEFFPFVSKGLFKVLREKDIGAAKILSSGEFSVLRNSYVAYLAVHDILRLKEKGKEEVERLLPTLNSEKELAYFEARELSSNFLFKGDRLKEFFPEYAGLEFFFTGMFVENLLWHEKDVKRQERRTEEYDFDVKF